MKISALNLFEKIAFIKIALGNDRYGSSTADDTT